MCVEGAGGVVQCRWGVTEDSIAHKHTLTQTDIHTRRAVVNAQTDLASAGSGRNKQQLVGGEGNFTLTGYISFFFYFQGVAVAF